MKLCGGIKYRPRWLEKSEISERLLTNLGTTIDGRYSPAEITSAKRNYPRNPGSDLTPRGNWGYKHANSSQLLRDTSSPRRIRIIRVLPNSRPSQKTSRCADPIGTWFFSRRTAPPSVRQTVYASDPRPLTALTAIHCDKHLQQL